MQCTLCDFTLFYILDTNTKTCKKKDLPNCKQMSPPGECLQCKEQYYLDKKCLAVPQDKKIKNCNFYLLTNKQINCSVCQKNFYLDDKRCSSVETKILNCRVSLESTCKECEKGYYPSSDRKSCFEQSKNPNCVSFTFKTCLKCKPGFSIHKDSQFVQKGSKLDFKDIMSYFQNNLVENT